MPKESNCPIGEEFPNLGSMLSSLIFAILAILWAKKWRFSQKPTL
jgi:hypothetical protein